MFEKLIQSVCISKTAFAKHLKRNKATEQQLIVLTRLQLKKQETKGWIHWPKNRHFAIWDAQ